MAIISIIIDAYCEDYVLHNSRMGWDTRMMSISLGDLLANRNFDEPREMVAIKQFVKETYDEDCEVLIHERDITITVHSASLANALRLKVNEVRATAQTTKRLVFRIR